MKDLFNVYHSSIFGTNPYKYYDYKGAIVGYKFLSLFDYSVFDYEKKEVQFYSDTIIMKEGNCKTSIILLKSIATFSLVITIVLIMKYIKLNKETF